MPKRRQNITMSLPEVWEFIGSRKSMHLSSLNRDGSPHLVTMWFTIVDDRIVLVSYKKSQKILNLRRNSQLAVLCEAGNEYHELRGVSINCEAELVDDEERVIAFEKSLILRNQPATSPEQAEAMATKNAPRKTAILVVPGKIKSWDHRKLDVDY